MKGVWEKRAGSKDEEGMGGSCRKDEGGMGEKGREEG